MSWKDTIKKSVYTVKTNPPLQGYKPPHMPMGQDNAFYHLKKFIIDKGGMTLRITDENEETPTKGNITTLEGQQVAEFEIVATS